MNAQLKLLKQDTWEYKTFVVIKEKILREPNRKR